MSGNETLEWTGAKPSIACTVDANGEVDPATYPDDLDKFPDTVKAVFISADPFFTETMDELVGAANRSGRERVCYPLQDYADAEPPRDTGETTLYGPGLKSAYKLLGRCARIARDSNAPVDPLLWAVPDVIKDI